VAPESEFDTPRGETTLTIHVPPSAHTYEDLAEGLTELDEELLGNHDHPRIYDSGAVYRSKSLGGYWRNANEVRDAGWGNCIDLAAWRAAELRVTGEDPNAFVYVYRSGRRKFHAVVGLGNGRIEDPSYYLGMRVPRGWQPIQFVGQTRRASWDDVEGDAP